MWKRWDITTRKQFMDHTATTGFALALVLPIVFAILGAICHTYVFPAIGMMLSLICGVVCVFTHIWGDWLAVHWDDED